MTPHAPALDPGTVPGAGSPERDHPRSAPMPVATIALVVVLAALTAVLLWASNRGFDQTDEGYYLLSYAHPDQSGGVSQFAQLVNVFLPDSSVRAYRLAGLGLQVVSSTLLAAAFLRWRRARQPGLGPWSVPTIAAMVVVVLAGLQGYAWLPQTLSYNTINGTLVNLAAALALVLVSPCRGRRERLETVGASFALGAVLLTQLFVKSPAALAVGALCVVLVVVNRGWRSARLPVLVTGAAGVATLLLIGRGRVFSLSGLIEGSRSAGRGNHSTAQLLVGYLGDALPWHLFHTATVVAWVLIFQGALRWGPAGRRGRAVGSAAVGSVFLFVGVIHPLGPLSYPAAALFPSLFLGLGVVAVAARVGRRVAASTRAASGESSAPAAPEGSEVPEGSQDRVDRSIRVGGRERWGVAAFLVLMPIGGAVGTSNTWQLQCLASAAPWGAAAVLLVAVMAARGPARRPAWRAVPLVVLAVVLAATAVRGVVFEPYRLTGSLLDQDTTVSGVPALDGILVDEASRTYLEGIVGAVDVYAGSTAGQPVLGVDALPGVVFVLGGYGPGTNWVSASDHEAVCAAWAAHPEEVAATRVVLLRMPQSAPLRTCLHEVWPVFPGQVHEVATIAGPDGSDVILAIVRDPGQTR